MVVVIFDYRMIMIFSENEAPRFIILMYTNFTFSIKFPQGEILLPSLLELFYFLGNVIEPKEIL